MAGNAQRLAAVSPAGVGREGSWDESTKGAHRLSFHKDGSSNDPWKATRHSYGNQDEARGAIQPVGFHRRLTSSTTFRSHPYVCSPLFFQPVPSLSNSSSPTPLLLTLFPSLFEPCPTVYKVVLLNWKPQLCRSYQLSHPLLPHFSSPFFPPHWAVPFSSPLLSTILLPLPLLTSVVQDARGTDRLSLSWHWGWLDLLAWPRFAKFSLSPSGRSCTWPDLGIRSSGGKFVCPDTASITAFLAPRPVHGDNRRLRFPAGSAVF